MGNCMRETTKDLEVQTLPLDAEPVCEVEAKTELSPSKSPVVISATSSFAFRPEELFLDRSFDVSKSLEHITQELNTSKLRQDEKFEQMIAQTKALEAQLEALHSRPSVQAPQARFSSQSSGQYLLLEQELEKQISSLGAEVGVVKKDVEVLQKQAKGFIEEED